MIVMIMKYMDWIHFLASTAMRCLRFSAVIHMKASHETPRLHLKVPIALD